MDCCRGCVRRTVIDIAVSNGSGWAVCLSIFSPKHVNESSFRSAFCSEYRTIAKVQERDGSLCYRQHSLLRALHFVLWHPVTSAGLLDGVAPSMGGGHREQCLRSRAECWNQKFENLIYEGVKIERGWRLVWTSPSYTVTLGKEHWEFTVPLFVWKGVKTQRCLYSATRET